MTTPAAPSNPKSAGDDRNLVAVDATTASTVEDQMHVFWQKYRLPIYAICAVILVGIVGKGVWDYMARQQELDVEKAYVAATTDDQLKSFIAAHPDHSLSGIAYVRMADEAYTAGKSAEALANYDKAIAVLKTGPLATRAQLGRALTKIQAGKAAEGTGELKQLKDDANQLKAVRAEAAYQLASLAADGGNAADAQKLVDELMKIDPASPWAQRGMMLRATLPMPEPVAPTAPAITAPAGTAPKADAKNEVSAPVQMKLPGK